MGVSFISTAGCIAQAMGLPVTFIAAVNANDIVGRTINSGDFSKVGDVHSSLSSAMDIQVSRSIVICSGFRKKLSVLQTIFKILIIDKMHDKFLGKLLDEWHVQLN